MTNFLTKGRDYLAAHPDFKLVGRAADLDRLTSILLRSTSSSVLLVGPGGVGCTALCMGLQAAKEAPDAPFDLINKRFFWLETDALFSNGTAEEITANFDRIMAVIKRTPDSVLIIEDARDFIDAARANGLGNFINSLNNAVKTSKIQVILETRDEDLDTVLKAHSEMRESYTLIDLAEPAREALRQIIGAGALQLQAHHGIRIAEDALDAAIELTTKYRTRDLGLSRAQPERSFTLLDRALSTYRLDTHRRHPGMNALLAELGPAAQSPEGQARIAALQAEYAHNQAELKRLYKNQRDGEEQILTLEDEIATQKKHEAERNKQSADAPAAPLEGVRKISLQAAHGGFESAPIVALRAKIRQFQDAVAANRQQYQALTTSVNERLELTRDAVVAQFSAISGISASKLNQDDRKKLRLLESNILERIFGQNEAVHRLSDAIKVAKVGRRSPNEPIASFLFLGPSGVGKTEIAKVLTHNLLDDADALTRFDMSEYMEKHAVAKLIGAPPGYEGFEAGGILTNAMRRNPVRVLLFDEIEKAHPDVYNIFLQILSDSRLTDNVGRVVSFDDAIIIMTTNIGQPHFLNTDLTPEEARAAALAELDKTYRAELLNRFAGRQNIVCFNRLELDSIGRIVRREIAKIQAKYLDSGVALDMTNETIDAFCLDQYDATVGGRGLPGHLKAYLEPALANLALGDEEFQGVLSVRYCEKARRFELTPIPHEVRDVQRSAA